MGGTQQVAVVTGANRGIGLGRLTLDHAGSFFRYEGERLDWFVD